MEIKQSERKVLVSLTLKKRARIHFKKIDIPYSKIKVLKIHTYSVETKHLVWFHNSIFLFNKKSIIFI